MPTFLCCRADQRWADSAFYWTRSAPQCPQRIDHLEEWRRASRDHSWFQFHELNKYSILERGKLRQKKLKWWCQLICARAGRRMHTVFVTYGKFKKVFRLKNEIWTGGHQPIMKWGRGFTAIFHTNRVRAAWDWLVLTRISSGSDKRIRLIDEHFGADRASPGYGRVINTYRLFHYYHRDSPSRLVFSVFSNLVP